MTKKKNAKAFPNVEKIAKNPVGRPTVYTEELADRICNLIAENPVSMETLIKENDWMPAQTTITRWGQQKPEFRLKYVQAKQEQVEAHVQHTMVIADKIAYETEKTANADVQRARLQIDVRQWYASRLAPRLYGEKSEGIEKDEKENENLTESERLEKISKILNDAKYRSENK